MPTPATNTARDTVAMLTLLYVFATANTGPVLINGSARPQPVDFDRRISEIGKNLLCDFTPACHRGGAAGGSVRIVRRGRRLADPRDVDKGAARHIVLMIRCLLER